MAYFLFKTEPDVYSFDDFLRDKETLWDGVTNPTAVKYLREMKAGTKWIFYHTGDERTAVGTGTVVSVDPSDPKVPIVKVKVGKRLKKPKTLADIKAEPLFAKSPLVVIGRLSVVPLTEEQWEWFRGVIRSYRRLSKRSDPMGPPGLKIDTWAPIHLDQSWCSPEQQEPLGAHLCGLNIARCRIDEIALVVLVVVANPGHGKCQPGFVAPLRRMVEEVIRADKHIQPARVTRIRVEDVSIRVLEEHAETRPLFAGKRGEFVVIGDLAAARSSGVNDT
jgi:predicted RNA-binding protein with PUA-like domain